MIPTRDWFTDAEVAALFASVHTPWWKAFLSLGVDVGLRPVEALNLTWTDIDPVTLSVRIRPRQASEHRASDGTVLPVLAFWPQHNGARAVPVPQYTIDALRRVRRDTNDDSPYPFVAGERLCRLFPLLDSGRSATTTDLAPGLGRVFASIQRQARVELAQQQKQPLAATCWVQKPLTALRNTFAQRAADAMRPADLAAHLGFARITAVLTHYDRSLKGEVSNATFRDRRWRE